MSQLPEHELERLWLDLRELETVDGELQRAVFRQLVHVLQAGDPPSFGGLDYVDEVLARTLATQDASDVVDRIARGGEQRPFAFLDHVALDRIVAVLQGESPQLLAIVLADLAPRLAARVIERLPDDVQADVTARIARLGDLDPEIVEFLSGSLREKLSGSLEHELPAAGGVEALAAILNYTEQSTERAVVDYVDARDEALAAELRARMFTFEDIVKLDSRAIQLLLREVNRSDLLLALRGSKPMLQERILSNLSPRAAALLVEEMELHPPVPRRVIDEARGRIRAAAMALDEAGAITIPRAGDIIIA